MRYVHPRSWRWTVLPALMLIIASVAPGLVRSGLAAGVEDGDDLPVIAQGQPIRPPGPLPGAWSISLSTDAGQPGTQVQVNGSGWWAGAPVELRWGSSDGPLLGEASPGIERGPSPGAFTLTITVPDAAPGAYDVWALGGQPEPFGATSVGGNQTGAGGAARGLGFRVEPATVSTSFVVVGPQPDPAPPAPLGPM